MRSTPFFSQNSRKLSWWCTLGCRREERDIAGHRYAIWPRPRTTRAVEGSERKPPFLPTISQTVRVSWTASRNLIRRCCGRASIMWCRRQKFRLFRCFARGRHGICSGMKTLHHNHISMWTRADYTENRFRSLWSYVRRYTETSKG